MGHRRTITWNDFLLFVVWAQSAVLLLMTGTLMYKVIWGCS